MLSLDSPQWSKLEHAYGKASNIPELLRQLDKFPSSKGDSEPWFSLWSSLAHQGDIYTASFAAVPHVVNYLSMNPLEADVSYFQLPAWIEICRQKNSIPIPKELEADYFSSLAKIPSLVAEATNREWDVNLLSCALSAIAAVKGFGTIAEAISELNTEIANDFLKWHLDL
jgi:hypothetical protein